MSAEHCVQVISRYVEVSRSALMGKNKMPNYNETFIDYKALCLFSWLLFKWTAVSHIQERRWIWQSEWAACCDALSWSEHPF